MTLEEAEQKIFSLNGELRATRAQLTKATNMCEAYKSTYTRMAAKAADAFQELMVMQPIGAMHTLDEALKQGEENYLSAEDEQPVI